MKKILGTFLLFSLFTAQAGWFDILCSKSKEVFSVSKQVVSEPAVIGAALGGLSEGHLLQWDTKGILAGVLVGAGIGSTISLVTGFCKGARAERGKLLLDFTHKERVRRTLLWACALSFVLWRDELTFKQAAISLIAIPIIDKAACWTLAKMNNASRAILAVTLAGVLYAGFVLSPDA